MITLVWDVDDVLNDLMRIWLEEWWHPLHSGCMIDFESINKNPPHQLLGVELDEYLQSLDDFRLSGRYQEMTPNSKVLEWFKRRGFSFRHIALTSVPRCAAPVSAAWVTNHFGNWIRTFHFVPSPRKAEVLPEYEATKADFLKWLDRADIFVDDNAINVHEVKSLGFNSFLVSRPWNSGGMKIEAILHDLTLMKSQKGEKQ